MPLLYRTVGGNCKKGNPTMNHLLPVMELILEQVFLGSLPVCFRGAFRCRMKHISDHNKKSIQPLRTRTHGESVFFGQHLTIRFS